MQIEALETQVVDVRGFAYEVVASRRYEFRCDVGRRRLDSYRILVLRWRSADAGEDVVRARIDRMIEHGEWLIDCVQLPEFFAADVDEDAVSGSP